MRISTNYQYDTFQLDIRNAQEKLVKVSQQLATGKRINNPSDDPVGVARTISMRSLRSGIDQYQKNLSSARGALGYIDNTAGDITDLVRQAYTLAVQGASSTTDQGARNAAATQIGNIQKRIIDLGNSKGPTGNYQFAGQKSSTKPYTLTGSTLTFNGDTNPIRVETGPGETIQSNVSGEPMITELYNRLEALKSDLIGGQVGAISGVDIANIQASLDSVTSLRGDVGTRMQTIDDLSTQWQRRSDELTKNISDIEDVDLSEAMVKYQQANQAYTAALTVAGQGFRLSLMDFIK
jgi:flagellar hook-associated protein 3 FlgL